MKNKAVAKRRLPRISDGVPMLRLARPNFTRRIVVLGHQSEEIARELKNSGVIIAENEDWQNGIGSSIRCGIERARQLGVDAALLLTCDQPLLRADSIRALLKCADEMQKPIVAAEYGGTLGIPALFARNFFPQLAVLDGDQGAKQIIFEHLDEVGRCPLPEAMTDIDVPTDAAAIGA